MATWHLRQVPSPVRTETSAVPEVEPGVGTSVRATSAQEAVVSQISEAPAWDFGA